MKPIIVYRDVEKSFGSKVIYNKLNLEIYPGEVLTVLGGSGMGKSVMIKMLIGLLRPDRGEIIYRNKNLATLSEREFVEVRKKISMVFQLSALFDSLSVFENIAFPLREHFRLSERELQKKVLEQLELVNLPPEIISLYPSELPGGMKKLVSLARSLTLDPEVILYDEPTTGLDPESTLHINKLIRKVQQQRGVTSIVITHDIAGAFYFSDRIAFLYDKRIYKLGNVDEIKNSTDPVLYRFIRGIPEGEFSDNL